MTRAEKIEELRKTLTVKQSKHPLDFKIISIKHDNDEYSIVIALAEDLINKINEGDADAELEAVEMILNHYIDDINLVELK